MSDASGLGRPTSVTVVLVLGWISVVTDLVAGVSLLLLADNDAVTSALELDSSSTARAVGIVSLIVGGVLAALIYGLGRGSNAIRKLVLVVMAIRIGISVWAILSFSSHNLTESVVTLVTSIAIMYLLVNASARAWYEAH
jgi:hypothetical protein